MKPVHVLFFFLFVFQTNARMVTLVTGGPWGPNTNEVQELQIMTNEFAELKSYSAYAVDNPDRTFYPPIRISFVKDGQEYPLYIPPYLAKDTTAALAITQTHHIIAGPATIRLTSTGSYCTFSVNSESQAFPPEKTLIIPAGSGANIKFECSTNLVDWVNAAPGTYTNLPVNNFFRIRADRIP